MRLLFHDRQLSGQFALPDLVGDAAVNFRRVRAAVGVVGERDVEVRVLLGLVNILADRPIMD